MFLRGLDESRGLDVSRLIGTYQEQANVSHTHSTNETAHSHIDFGHTHGGSTDLSGDHNHAYTGWAAVPGAGAGIGSTQVYGPSAAGTGSAGLHNHGFITASSGANISSTLTGISIQSQGSEGHPRNLAWPMYIKF
jgi:hypothetical protein